VLWSKRPSFLTLLLLLKLHRPKVSECINSRFLSLTYRVYKVLTTTQPSYLYKLISVQSPHNTRSSFCCHHFLDHHHLPVKITNRSIRSASLHLWNQLPASFRQSYTSQSPSHSPAVHVNHHHFYCNNSFFHSTLKTYIFTRPPHRRLLVPKPRTAITYSYCISKSLCPSVCFIFFYHYFY